MADLEALRRSPTFTGLSRRELEAMAHHMDELDFRAGEVLIEQGAHNHALYVIVAGAAEVSIDGRPRATLKVGDVFGEISMEGHGAATATVTAAGPLTALVMSREQY